MSTLEVGRRVRIVGRRSAFVGCEGTVIERTLDGWSVRLDGIPPRLIVRDNTQLLEVVGQEGEA